MTEELPLPPRPSWWRRPISLGLLGLLLMLGGWKLSTGVPLSPHQEQQAETLAELRRLAGEGELANKLDEYAQRWPRQAASPMVGRLILFVGLILFATAAVRMYRTPADDKEKELRT
jgi:hypothetical protein